MNPRKIASWLLFDQICPLCRVETVPAELGICSGCCADLQRNHSACPKCAMPTPISIDDQSQPCHHCLTQQASYSSVRAPFIYSFPIRQVISQVKETKNPDALHWLAKLLVSELQDCARETIEKNPVLVPIPMHRNDLRKRGFNQSEILARALGKSFDLALDLQIVEKRSQTQHQRRLNRRTRLDNVVGSFAVQSDAPAHVVLVDDVMTTGATLNAASQALVDAGCEHVDAWVLCRTP